MTNAATTPSTSEAGNFPSEDELRPEIDPVTGIDLSLIDANLKLTPWERVLANNDVINFIDGARAALKRRHAAS